MISILFLFLSGVGEAYHVQDVNLAELRDPDVATLKLEDSWLGVEIHTLRGKRNWTFQLFRNLRKKEGPTWFVPHDNENDAFLAGIYAIKKYGGQLLAIDCNERRLCDGIDPNRHFFRKNTEYTNYVLSHFTNRRFPFLTLHNNHDRHHTNGGQGAIDSSVKNPYRGAWSTYNSGDPDDLIIYADHRPRSQSEVFSFVSNIFANYSLNSIFEHISPRSRTRGHMSSYVVRHTDRGYFNIEAQHGHLFEQKRIVDQIMRGLIVKNP